jgi:hypothetical protein
MIKGKVEGIHTASQAAERVTPRDEVVVVEKRGIKGDRYYEGKGTFSKSNSKYAEGSSTSGRDLTLIEAEVVEAVFKEYQIEIKPGGHRRNITTRGVALNHLVGKKFRIGEVMCKGVCLCTPCHHMESLNSKGAKTQTKYNNKGCGMETHKSKGVREALIHRGGLRADILEGGVIKVGATIEEVIE